MGGGSGYGWGTLPRKSKGQSIKEGKTEVPSEEPVSLCILTGGVAGTGTDSGGTESGGPHTHMPRALTTWEEVLRPPGRDAGCLTLRLNYNFCLEPRRAVNPLPKNWVRADTLTSCLT